ncbi:hypothetical protein ccbrp13_38020 [Ktedonobacteria bacterium brp13]|nr:hypothetical protein ccbrp13_38020 [Ktedonobacteria bacterium brp13]
MLLHIGERVFWGAPEVIYLEGPIVALDAEQQTATIHIERATPHSAHLINTNLPFAINGLVPLKGQSPPGTTTQASTQRIPPPILSDDEKVRRTAATAVHQRYGYTLPADEEQHLIDQVQQELERDPAVRARIITTMDEILKREW